MGNQYTKKEININEIVSLYNSGISFTKIALDFKIGKNRVKKILIENDNFIQNRDTLKKIFNDFEINDIKDLYLNKKLSCKEIGKIYNISREPIQELLRNLGLLNKGNSNGVKIVLTEEKEEKIKKLYLNECKNTDEISNELGLNKSYIDKYLSYTNYRRNKSLATSLSMIKKYHNISYNEYLSKLSEYKKYKNKVISITKKQNINTLINFNKRGVSGIAGAYHLDHKFSILEGFKNKISPEIIGNIVNLEFIPWEENLKKKNKCSITITQLLKQI